jgi:hypothetical protein
MSTDKPNKSDDPIDLALKKYSEESKLKIGNEALLATIAAIPWAGGPIGAILTGRGQRRVYERAQDVFKLVGEKLSEIREDKVDKKYFETEEFMTILLLAIEQLQTNHDKKKREMLAEALANSGRIEYSSESRKELFMRIFRDLAPEHLAMLDGMAVNVVVTEKVNPTEEDLTLLQGLAAHGLMEESYEREEPSIPAYNAASQREIEAAVSKMIMAPIKHRFRVSRFGLDFVKFFSHTTGDSSETQP